jgi:uncharacterized membrane protein
MVNLVINKNVEVKLSLEWVKRSFVTFREYPLQFILLAIVATIIGLLPFIGAFMTPLFVAQFMVLTEKVESHQPFLLSEVFRGLFSKKIIVRLAFINFCLSATLVTAQYLVELLVTPYMQGVSAASFITSPSSIIFMPLILILQVSMWLAPIICLTNKDISPFGAMWWSLKVTCYNVPVLFVYSILITALTLLALLPLGLGLLIWLPILNITSYYVYYSLFSQK